MVLVDLQQLKISIMNMILIFIMAIHELKDKINNKDDLNILSQELKDLEREITLFHAKAINDLKIKNENILIGFHGQTIYHNAKKKISKQLGDAKLLNHLTKKNCI